MIRTTLRGILMFVGLVGIAGAAMAWYVWVRGDEYAKEELGRRLAEIAPACDLRFGQVRFDWQKSLTVSDFSLGSKNPAVAPALTVPEAVLHIDRKRFLNDQTIEVELIQFLRPRFEVTRRMDGTWSTDDLFPFHATDIQVPEWRAEDATIVFNVEQSSGEPIALTLEHADLRLEPIGRRQFAVTCVSSVADTGPLQVTGTIDIDSGAWSLAGTISGITTSGNLAEFALESSEGLRGQVAKLERKLQDVEDSMRADDRSDSVVGSNTGALRTVSRQREEQLSSTELDFFHDDSFAVAANGADAASSKLNPRGFNSFGDLGIEAIVDLEFSAGRTSSGRPLDYKLHVACRDGEITNPLLPFPLKRLRGRIDLTRDLLSLKGFEADAGRTSLKFEGTITQGNEAPEGAFGISVTDFVLTDQPDGRLPPATAQLIEKLRPAGPIDLLARFQKDTDGRWSVQKFELTAKGAAVTAEPFPFPIREIVGTLRQERPGRFVVDMVGKAGMRPVQLNGYVNNPGEANEVHMQIRADQIPLDETFLNSCPPQVQEILRDLALAGTARELDIRIERASGIDQDFVWGFQGRLEQGQIQFAGFPYRLTNVAGDVSYDSRLETLSIWNAQGRHDDATISASGTYRQIPEIGPDGASPIVDHRPGLDLALTTKQVSLNGDLRDALPQGLKSVWDDLRPSGLADSDVKVTWLPGYQADIEVKSFEVSKGSIRSRIFPYTLESIIAKGSFVPWRSRDAGGRLQTAPARLTFSELVGWHPNGIVRVDASGSSVELAYGGGWQFRAPRFVAEDIQFAAEFRRAVPEELRGLLETLNPRGRFLVDGELELRQAERSRELNADWDLTVSTKGMPATLNAGVELKSVLGRVRSRGQHKNGVTEGAGSIALDQAEVLGQKLTRVAGPLRFTNERIEIGSVEVARQSQTSVQEPDVPIEERLSGSYLDGLLTFDAIVLLETQPRYAGRVALTAGSLERYAVSQSTGPPPNLAGVMTGWMNFTGQGSTTNGLRGRGRLDISPAALYELPVIMKMFKALVLVPPDGPAFSSAQLIFSLHDSAVFFDPREGGLIDLAGDTLRLRGGGRVGFDRTLDLEFYSSLPRNSTQAFQAVPVVGPLVGGVVQAATTGWVSVVVRGPADDPFVNTVPGILSPELWRQMFESPSGRIPARTAVGVGPRR